jgi:para-aminobenzoate synthetase/4-amino-4-deoxychorismate lyase
VDDVFVLLDDCDSSELKPSSRLYTGCVRQHVCCDPGLLDEFWEHVETDISGGLHAAIFADLRMGREPD